MYANTCWGLLGLAVTFALAVLGLPNQYEWLAPWFIGAAAACGIGSVICFAWPLREKDNRVKVAALVVHPAKALRLIEPSHIIILGLVIAVAGVVWQWRRTSPDDPRMAQLQSQLTSMQSDLKEAKKLQPELESARAQLEDTKRQLAEIQSKPKQDAPARRLSLIVPGRFYSRSEKEQIVDALNAVQAVFNGDGRLFAREAAVVASGVSSLIQRRRTEAISDLVDRLSEANKKAEEVDRRLEKIRSDQATEPMISQLLASKPVAFATFKDSIGELLNAMLLHRDIAAGAAEHKDALNRVLDAQAQNLIRAENAYVTWVEACEKLIQATRMEIKE